LDVCDDNESGKKELITENTHTSRIMTTKSKEQMTGLFTIAIFLSIIG
jgi:hypothetical protein